MELNLDFRRLFLFAVLVGGFALFGGFTRPERPPQSYHNAISVQKAWTYCMALYVIGAGLASLTDHWAGTMEPVNLRPLYILLGGLLMLTGGLWQRSLRESVETKVQPVSVKRTYDMPPDNCYSPHALITCTG